MPVTVTSEGAVHIITLDSGKNVFNPAMLSDIHAAIDQVEVLKTLVPTSCF
jgi:enoyl-CoA hydratase/carnithine racemase